MKTALDYARETLDWYENNSWLNPRNMKSPLMQQDSDRAIAFRLERESMWKEMYDQQKIVTYLETILERLPYELPKDK
jgi:hypothetical protein